MKVYRSGENIIVSKPNFLSPVYINVNDVVILEWGEESIGVHSNESDRTYRDYFNLITDEFGVAYGGTFQDSIDAIRDLLIDKGIAETDGEINRLFNYVALNYTNLQAIAPNPIEGDIAFSKSSEGSKWLPWSLGGSYYPSGIYYFDGIDWISDKESIAEQLQINVDDIDGLEMEVQSNDSDITTLQNNLTNHILDFNNPHQIETLYNSDGQITEERIIQGNQNMISFDDFDTIQLSSSTFLLFDSIANIILTSTFIDLEGIVQVFGDITADNLSGTNTGDQDISGIGTNAIAISNLQSSKVDSVTSDFGLVNNTDPLNPKILLPFMASKDNVEDGFPDGVINNTGAFFKISEKSFTIPVLAIYEVELSFTWAYDNTGNDFQLLFNLVDPLNVSETLESYSVEPKESGGTGVNLPTTTGGTDNTGTNQRMPGGTYKKKLTLGAGIHKLNIEFRGEQAGAESTLFSYYYKIKRIG